MDYTQQSRSSVTMLDELPELVDVESSQGHMVHHGPQGSYSNNQSGYQSMDTILPNGEADKYRKMIRQPHVIPPDAGMAPMIRQAPEPEPQDDRLLEPRRLHQPDPLHDISCLHIANHIYECPICSRFYKCDKTVYIICIVVLAIVCLLLLKRVLEV